MGIEIKVLDGSSAYAESLAALHIEAVNNGASLSFLKPLAHDKAVTYWRGALADAAKGNRVIFGAFNGDALTGTVTLWLEVRENQPHRAEIQKLIVASAHQRRGIARKLMEATERHAARIGRFMLTLGTTQGATEGAAAKLFEKTGWTLTGIVPDNAYLPGGGMGATRYYWKKL